MRYDDRPPADDDGRHGDREEEHEDLTREEVVQHDGEERHARGDEDADDGHAPARKAREHLRCVAARREPVEHARVAVDRRVVDGNGGGQDDEVQDVCGGGYADVREYLHEGARLHADLVPAPKRHEHRHGADVEDQDAPDDLIDGARNRAVGVGSLARRDANELDAAEGEHDDRDGEQHAPDAVGEEAAVRPEVAEVHRERFGTRKDEVESHDDHEHDGCDLDDRKPELQLAVRADGGEVQRRDDDERHERREPLRQVGQPVVHVDADDGKFRHADDDVVEPIVPA